MKDSKFVVFYQLAKLSKCRSTSTGLILLTSFSTLLILGDVYFLDSLKQMKNSRNSFLLLYLISLGYLPLMVLSIWMNSRIALQHLQKIKESNLLLECISNISTRVLFIPLEYFIFPAKIILFSLIISDNEIMHQVENSLGYTGKVMTYGYSFFDVLICFMTTLFKVKILRIASTEQDFFYKDYSNFEVYMTIAITILGAINTSYILTSSIGDDFEMYYRLCKFPVYLALIYNFFSQMPFVLELTELYYYAALLAPSILSVISIAYSKSHQYQLLIFCVLFPMLLGVGKVLLKNFMNNINYTKTKVSLLNKRIYRRRVAVDSKLSISNFESNSEIFGHIYACKLLHCPCHELYNKFIHSKKKMISVKRATEEISIKSELGELFKQPNKNLEISSQEKIIRLTEATFMEHAFRGQTRPIEDNLLKCRWSIKYNLRLFQVLDTLKELKHSQKSMPQSFGLYCIMIEFQSRLSKIYKNKELYLNTIYVQYDNNEREIEKITIDGVDIVRALKIKNRLTKLTQKVKASFQHCLEFNEFLAQKIDALSRVHELASKSYYLAIECDRYFLKIIRTAYQNEHLHLGVYYFYLMNCRNYYSTSTELYKLFKNKLNKLIHLSDEKSLELTDQNLLYNSLIFLVDTEKQCFGKILDVYGDCSYLELSPDNLVGRSADEFIPSCLISAHKKVSKNYMNGQMSEILGDNFRRSFIKIPQKQYILACGLTIKMVPDMKYGFKAMTVCKIDWFSSTMHMILDSNGLVNGYSSNMKDIFEEPDDFLTLGIEIKLLSIQVNRKFKSLVRERRKRLTLNKYKKKNLLSTNTISSYNQVKMKEEELAGLEEMDESIHTNMTFKHKKTDEVLNIQFRVKLERVKMITLSEYYVKLSMEFINVGDIFEQKKKFLNRSFNEIESRESEIDSMANLHPPRQALWPEKTALKTPLRGSGPLLNMTDLLYESSKDNIQGTAMDTMLPRSPRNQAPSRRALSPKNQAGLQFLEIPGSNPGVHEKEMLRSPSPLLIGSKNIRDRVSKVFMPDELPKKWIQHLNINKLNYSTMKQVSH